MYKIVFSMVSPIAYQDIPVFDSIVAFCEYQDTKRTKYDGHKSRMDFEPIPIDHLLKREGDFYLASYGILDSDIESTDRWRKRWRNKYDFLADFGKAQRRVNTGSGELRSFDMPIVIHSCKTITFYFDSPNVEEVKRLIETHLVGIGKKVAYGFGWFSSFSIEECDIQGMLYHRPLPIDYKEKFPNYRVSYGALKIPYWAPQHQEEVIVP